MHHSTSVARLIPLVVILPLLVLGLIGYMLRRRLALFFKKVSRPVPWPSRHPPTSGSTRRALTPSLRNQFQHPPASDAPETTSTGGPPVTVTPASASASTSTAALVPRTTGGITSSDRPVADRRSRRRRRRSRDSVVGLPLYSEEPDEAVRPAFVVRDGRGGCQLIS